MAGGIASTNAPGGDLPIGLSDVVVLNVRIRESSSIEEVGIYVLSMGIYTVRGN